MISSEFRKVLMIVIRENAESILGRPIKDWELTHFLNMYEDKLAIIINRAKHNLELMVNEYLEEIK